MTLQRPHEHGRAADRAAPLAVLSPAAVRGVLISLALVLLAASLDSTAVGTALPRIVADLDSADLYTWVFTVYLLAMTASMPLFGSLSDRLGRRPILFLGLVIFVAGSILCGFAAEMWQLVLFRAFQGLGAGAIVPVTLAIVGDLFPPADRARVQALFGSLFVLAFLIGPTLGGVFTDTIGWRWVFYINLPVSLVAMLGIWRLMPPLRGEVEPKRFDLAGVVLFVCAVVPFLIGVRNLPGAALADPEVGGLMLLGLAFGVAFLIVEAWAGQPIVPVRLFADATFAVASTVVFLSVAGLFVGVVFLPRYFQLVHGASATASGWQIMALLAGLIGGAIGGGVVVARTGRWKLLLLGGMVVGATGMALLTTIEADSELPFVWGAMLLTGLGLGPITSVLTAVIQSVSPKETMGVATSALTTFRQLGASVWLAIGGSWFSSVFDERLPGTLREAGVPGQLATALSSDGGGGAAEDVTVAGELGATVLAALPEEARGAVEPFIGVITEGVHQAVSLATGNVFWIGIGAVTVAFLVLLPLREVPLPRRERTAQAEGPSEPLASAAPGTGDAPASGHPSAVPKNAPSRSSYSSG